MLLRKAHGGATIGEYAWPHDGDVCDVDEKTAADLLRTPGGEFSVVEPGTEPTAPPEPDAPATDEPGSEPTDPPTSEPGTGQADEPQAAAGHVIEPASTAEANS